MISSLHINWHMKLLIAFYFSCTSLAICCWKVVLWHHQHTLVWCSPSPSGITWSPLRRVHLLWESTAVLSWTSGWSTSAYWDTVSPRSRNSWENWKLAFSKNGNHGFASWLALKDEFLWCCHKVSLLYQGQWSQGTGRREEPGPAMTGCGWKQEAGMCCLSLTSRGQHRQSAHCETWGNQTPSMVSLPWLGTAHRYRDPCSWNSLAFCPLATFKHFTQFGHWHLLLSVRHQLSSVGAFFFLSPANTKFETDQSDSQQEEFPHGEHTGRAITHCGCEAHGLHSASEGGQGLAEPSVSNSRLHGHLLGTLCWLQCQYGLCWVQ